MKLLSSIIDKQPVSGVYWIAQELQLEVLVTAPHCKLYHIKGSQIHTRQEFLDAAQIAMDAPEHCKYSWDTLLDCMRGIERPSSPIKVCIFLYDSIEVFAKSNPDEFQTALKIFEDATDAWREGAPQKRMFFLLSGDKSVVASLPVLI